MLKHLKRRSFIRGAAGATLALPFLSSLAPRRAEGQGETPLRLVVFVSKNGVYGRNWHETSRDPMTNIGEHAHSMPLADFAGNPINRTLGTTYEHLYSKMNLIRGLDIVCEFQGHNTPAPLSASCTNRESIQGTCNPIYSFPHTTHSMDTLLDERIYDAAPTMRAMRIAPFLDVSSSAMRWLQLSHRDGDGISSETSIASIYQQLFGDLPDGGSLTAAAERQRNQLSAVDSALPEIQRIISGGRISRADQLQLEMYLDRMTELRGDIAERQVAICEEPGFEVREVDGYDTPLQFHQNINEMITSAFTCDMTRIAVVSVNHGTTNPRQAYLHPNSHHEFREPAPEFDAIDLGYYQTQASFFMDLVERLDGVEDGDGNTILDNTICLWVNTLGTGDYHRSNNVPILMAGSGGGQIQTGQFLDYEQRPTIYENGLDRWRNLGRPYHFLLQDIMRCFNLGPSDWEMLGEGNGFGDFMRAERNRDGAWDRYLSDRRQSLPGFLRG